MADGISITSGTGVTVATDDDGSAQHQWVKIEIGGNGSFVPVTTVNGLPVQVLSLPALNILSLPPLGAATVSLSAGTIISISGITSAITSLSAGTTVLISSLPPLGAATVSLSAGTIISISGLTSAIVSISNLPISVKVESLPNLAVGSIISVSGLTSAIVSLSAGSIISVSGLTSAITSLSPGTIVSISGLTSAITSLSAGTAVTISNLASVPLTVSGTVLSIRKITPNYFSYSSTYTAALTTGTVLVAIQGSYTAIYVSDVHFSNGATQGNMALYCSRSNAALITLIPDTHFMDRGGLVTNLGTPLVCDTNSALLFTTMTCTSHSVMVSGYISG